MKFNYKHKNQKTYVGAGIILIEMYRDKIKNKMRPSVLLFIGSYDKKYQDLGGSIEVADTKHSDPLAYTAIRETMEESRNMIVFTNTKYISQLDYIDIPIKKPNENKKVYYRSYIVGIPSNLFHTIDFMRNKKILDNANVPNVWKETTGVKRFFLDEILKCVGNNHNNIGCSGTDGTIYNIRNRTIKLLQLAARNNKINHAVQNPVQFHKIKTKRTHSMISLVV